MNQYHEHETAIIKAIETAAEKRHDKAEDSPRHWHRHTSAARALEKLAAAFAAHDYDPALMASYAAKAQGLTITAAVPYFAAATTPDELLTHILRSAR